jgi:nucleotide-binding universal stress UspA family protein
MSRERLPTTLDRGAQQRAASLAEEGAERLRSLGMEASPVAVSSAWNTWTTILDVAEEHDAALVAVGSRGLSGVKSALLGSVSNAVLHHCSRPVLVVHPGETTGADPG